MGAGHDVYAKLTDMAEPKTARKIAALGDVYSQPTASEHCVDSVTFVSPIKCRYETVVK